MADITFRGNKKLESINEDWCGKFPYLYLSFYNAAGNIEGDWNNTHASIRGEKGASELSTNAGMQVETFESRYESTYGCKVEIKYLKNDRKYRSLGDHNEMTLNEFNDWAKENGASIITETKPEWF